MVLSRTSCHQYRFWHGVSSLLFWNLIIGCWILISKYNDGHVALSFPLVGKTGRFGKTRNRSTNLYSTTNEVTIDSTTSTTEEAIRLGKEKLAGYFKFPLDDWQLEAGGSILMGYNVVVCAPTGSGKVRFFYCWCCVILLVVVMQFVVD